MKPLPKDVAALLVASPQLRPGDVKARVSSLVNADQDVLDALRGWAREEPPPKKGDAT